MSGLGLSCGKLSFSRKNGRTRASKCKVVRGPKDMIGKMMSVSAELNPGAMRVHKAKRARRSKKAKANFNKPIPEVAWQCRSFHPTAKGAMVGSDCRRTIEGLGKPRIQRAKQVTVFKPGVVKAKKGRK